MRRRGIILTVTIALLVGCKKHSGVEYTLRQAGSNRSELESVLSHYSIADANAYKLKAAEFLIENMPAHYSYAGQEIYQYYEYAEHILADTTLSPEQQRDSLLSITDKKYRDLPNYTVPDAQIIKADYLIENIDKTYAQWTTCPWASQITFDEYLEWMLPYKAVELQELDYWRDSLLAHFGYGLENPIKNDVEYNTAMGVADMLRRDAESGINRHGLYTRAGLPMLSAYLLPRQTFGDIPDYALVAVLLMRSAGVPAVLDETPVGSRYTAAVRWFAILDDKGMERTSEWDLSTTIGNSFFPYERGPKVYRNTYAINPERWEYKQNAKYQYPFELGKKDVTSKYFRTTDISIPIDKDIRKQIKDRYVYITSAVRNDENPWQIVDFGVIKHGKALFHDMGLEVLYQIQGYDGETLIPISDPFILNKDRTIEYVSADTLNSKYLDKWKNNAI